MLLKAFENMITKNNLKQYKLTLIMNNLLILVFL